MHAHTRIFVLQTHEILDIFKQTIKITRHTTVKTEVRCRTFTLTSHEKRFLFNKINFLLKTYQIKNTIMLCLLTVYI